jgi:hypothetical protein
VGIAVLEVGSSFRCLKAVGKLENLAAKVGD